MRRRNVGFTLMEVVVVIAIIGILTAVIVPTFSIAVNKAKRSADLQQLYELNMMLLTGEISKRDLKNYSLQTKGWELAYSESENDLVIVDGDGKIVAAANNSFVGSDLGSDYTRVDELDFSTPEGPTEPEGPSQWWDIEAVTELPAKDSDEYNALIAKQDIRLSVAEMPEKYFEKTAIKRVYIDDKLTTLPQKAFYECKALEEVHLESVTTICDYAFASCTALKELALPSLQTLSEKAFNGCSFSLLSLPCVEFPESPKDSYVPSAEHLEINGGTMNSRMALWINSVAKNSIGITITLKNVTAEKGIAPFKGLRNICIEMDQATYDSFTKTGVEIDESLLTLI